LKVKNYFDIHSHDHAYHLGSDFYQPVVYWINKNKSDKKKNILDVGCGDGNFLKCLSDAGINADFYGTDISYKMIKTGKDNLDTYKHSIFVADMLSIPIKYKFYFDVIHMSMILHHLIGNTRAQSFHLAKKMLDNLTKILSKNGFLIVEEVCSESYFIPSITSSMIFYGLKFFNFFHLDLSKVKPEIQLGLEVNFFHKDKLKNMLEKYGNVTILREKSLKISRQKRLLFLKSFSTVSFLVELKDDHLQNINSS